MLEQNFTAISSLLGSINASVIDDLEVITMFDGTVNGTTVMDIRTRLQNLYTTISNLNISSFNFSQTLYQTLIEAESLESDFDNAMDDVNESLMCLDETTQLLSIAEGLISITTMQNFDNRNNLSLLNVNTSILHRNLQEQLNRVQNYQTQLDSTYFRAKAVWYTLTQSEQELLNSSIVIEQLYNYSNVTLDLSTDAIVALQRLNVRKCS